MSWTLPAKDGATGQIPYELLRCTCRHLSPVHTLTTNGRRGVCTGAAWCKCEGFTEAKERS
jgi:hypothetical protein